MDDFQNSIRCAPLTKNASGLRKKLSFESRPSLRPLETSYWIGIAVLILNCATS